MQIKIVDTPTLHLLQLGGGKTQNVDKGTKQMQHPYLANRSEKKQTVQPLLNTCLAVSNTGKSMPTLSYHSIPKMLLQNTKTKCPQRRSIQECS